MIHQGFNTSVAPITNCMRKGKFRWNEAVRKAFEEIKCKMNKANVLSHLNFSKVFEVACNAPNVDIDGLLS